MDPFGEVVNNHGKYIPKTWGLFPFQMAEIHGGYVTHLLGLGCFMWIWMNFAMQRVELGPIESMYGIYQREKLGTLGRVPEIYANINHL